MTTLTQGNTSPNGNTSRNIRARIWHIVINNYTEEDVTRWHQVLEETTKYKWQYEVGENGTKHIQGHIEFKNARTFKSLKNKLPRANISKVRNIQASADYCNKEETSTGEKFSKGFEEEKTLEELILEEEYSNVVWKPWQQDIINVLESTPDRRKIYWIQDDIGNSGKSFLCKYIALKYDAIICSGKTNDIFNQLNNWRLKNPKVMRLPPCLVDVPRSEFSHINYAAIESLKNGLIYSGKYEGGKVYGLSPHVIIFANSPFKEGQMSEDRWVHINLH